MLALTATQLLAVWEHGTAMSAPRRALLLLGAAAPDSTPDEFGRLPVGQRDDLLLRLRAAVFGPRIEATATCPSCADRLELGFSSDELPVGTVPAAAAPLLLECAGHSVTLRLLDASDLVALTAVPDPAEAEAELLRRCVLSARSAEGVVAPDALPAGVVSAIAARLAEADPQADIRLSLACPSCEHRFEESFDIVSFFWREIDAWAGRTLREVHTLATAYGWSESEIVTLSPARRRLYLEMVTA